MTIQRFEPFREMVSLRDAMNSLFQESFVRPLGMQTEGNAVMLPLDISEDEDEFVIKASLPGVRPEDVQITAHGDTVTIRGEVKGEEEKQGGSYHLRERRFGQFQRTVVLPTPVRAEGARAQFENGVLTLTLPKAEEAKPKQIKIEGASQSQVGQSASRSQAGQGAAQSQVAQETAKK
jgi:HSP20 family protein